MAERYKCDRNGGVRARSQERRAWICPSCGVERFYAGHVCQDCHRRVCCQCFHHDLGACLTAGGSDVRPSIPIPFPCVPRTRRAAQEAS